MFLRREHLAALVLAVSVAASTQPTYAQVDMWHTNGVPLSTAGGDYYPAIATDMAGGAFVTWVDHRTSTQVAHIYAQHVLASGAVDSRWPVDGLGLCTAVGAYGAVQQHPTIVTDGAGGVIVTWDDAGRVPNTPDIYAQRVNAAGVVQWTEDGVALCTAVGIQQLPTILTVVAGGAIVTWEDFRINGSPRIYAQRVNDNGVVQWATNGVRLCTALGAESTPTIATDMAGGAVVTWSDGRAGGTNYDIYAQWVNDAGMVQWAADGVALCTAAFNQTIPQIVSDGASGAFVTWQDARGSAYDIYAQHVQASGAVDPAWTANGTRLGTAMGNQTSPMIVTDGLGGAIVTWSGGYLIYAQRVLSTGGVQWAGTGVVLSGVNSGSYPTIVTDGDHGAIVTWEDLRFVIYAQRVLASGAVDPAWTAANGNANGTLVCATNPRAARAPAIATDMAGGAIVTWMDQRSGSLGIYAQRVFGSGVVAAVATEGQSYSFAVHAPHPNPANAQATISFDLASPQPVSVRVYDVTGRLVRTLAVGGELGPGSHSLMWNGASDSGTLARAGIYFIQVSAGNAVQTRRMAIIR